MTTTVRRAGLTVGITTALAASGLSAAWFIDRAFSAEQKANTAATEVTAIKGRMDDMVRRLDRIEDKVDKLLERGK
jgi:hypothetical protein